MVNRLELKKKYGEEEVLAVPLKSLPKLEEGFTKPKTLKGMNKMLEKAHFIPRWASDDNPLEVEIIPYPIIRTLNSNKVFCVKRIGGSNEKRLVNKLSLGIGGHINPDPRELKGQELLLASLQRELMEELEFDNKIMPNTHLQINGFIRLTETSVDKDHLGIMFTIIVPDEFEDKFKVRETDTLEGEFMPIAEVKKDYDKLENWSKIVIDNALPII